MFKAYVEPIGTGAVVYAIAALVLVVPYLIWQYRKHGQVQPRRFYAHATFALFLFCAWALVLLPFPASDAAACARQTSPNLEPFAWWDQTLDWAQRRGNPGILATLTSPPILVRAFNVALLVPLGVYLRRWFGKGLLATTALGFLMSLAFEVTQYTGIYGIYSCAYRVFDVDDLMANTLGAVVGWIIAPVIFLVPRPGGQTPLPAAAHIASAPRRALGALLDLAALIAGYVICLLGVILLVSAAKSFGWLEDVTTSHLQIAAWVVNALLLFVLIPRASNGATIGKGLLRMRIRARDGGPAGMLRLAARIGVIYALVAAGSMMIPLATQFGLPRAAGAAAWALLVLSPLLSILFSHDRRGIHDVIAGTKVVALPPGVRASEATPQRAGQSA